MLKTKECRKFMKKCSSCGQVKLINNFTTDRGFKDKHKKQCKECIKNKYKHTCTVCGKEFKSNRIEQDYCSISCSNIARNESKVECECEICGNKMLVIASRYKKNKHNYCSIKCSRQGASKFYSGENHHLYDKIKVECSCCQKEFSINKYKYENQTNYYCSRECKYEHQKEILIGDKNPFYNKRHTLHTKTLISNKNLGKVSWIKGKHQSESAKAKLRLSWTYDRKAWYSEKFSGEGNPAYNPCLTQEEREDRRNLFGYANWRSEIYKRDNYTCQCCHNKKSNKLKSHHLNGYNWDKEHRLDVNNGVTLCENCHKEFHHYYGYGNNTKEQFEEYIHNNFNKEAI